MSFHSIERHNEYHREYKAARRAEWFAGKSCVECDSSEDLQADHIDPAGKSPHIKISHNVWSWSKEKREAELAKCQVLCESCHKKKTSEWWAAQRQHGAETLYRLGCRCDPCRINHNARSRIVKERWRARRRKQGLPVT